MKTDKQCHICHEEFNDDWECSTLCVHDECLRHLRDELESEKEKYRIAIIHAKEYKAWVEKSEAELATERLALKMACRHVLPASVQAIDPTFDMDTISNDHKLLADYFRNRVSVYTVPTSK